MTDKICFRKEMINIRKNIINKKEKSKVIMNKLINLDIYNNSKVIAIYNSMKDEVDTSDLIKYSLKKKEVLLPKIINDKMVFVRINDNTKYKKSSIGVNEPIGNEYLGKIDLIIVPGVSFDENLNRLGFGKGYYDRYLLNKDIYKIGICYSEQLVDSLPIENHDIKMNLVITEKEFY